MEELKAMCEEKLNGVETGAYFTHCLRNHRELSRRADDFLPWVFREREMASTGPTGPPQPPLLDRPADSPSLAALDYEICPRPQLRYASGSSPSCPVQGRRRLRAPRRNLPGFGGRQEVIQFRRFR